jgi:metallo-beta-lactamase family protein
LKLCDLKGPAIILAGSGMCTGGRIVDHLAKRASTTPKTTSSSSATRPPAPPAGPSSVCQRPGGYVVLDGERKTIKARVHTLSGYSAHADQKGLVDWIESMPEKPRRRQAGAWGNGRAKRFGRDYWKKEGTRFNRF